MSFVSLTDAEIAVDKPITQSLFQKIKDNFDSLNGYIAGGGSAGVSNGSAEIDSDADDVPDGWTASEYTGGTIGIYTTAPEHGAAAFYMTHPGGAGNGGGTFTSDYVACDDMMTVSVDFIHWATAAGMKNQVNILWYDEDKVALGTPSTNAYSSTSNPTSATRFQRAVVPQSGARYYRVQLVGGYTDTDVTGTAYFDGVSSAQDQNIGYGASSSGVVVGGFFAAETYDFHGGYTKAAEFLASQSGTVYITFYLQDSGSNDTSYARIYVNGVATGTAHSINTAGGRVEKTDSAISVSKGDYLQLYVYSTGASTEDTVVDTFLIKSLSGTPFVRLL